MNLMDLNPYEFEQLVANTFAKMGLESRLTRSSRDGGVDCVCLSAQLSYRRMLDDYWGANHAVCYRQGAAPALRLLQRAVLLHQRQVPALRVHPVTAVLIALLMTQDPC